MIFKLIRWPLGQLILLVDFLTAPGDPSAMRNCRR